MSIGAMMMLAEARRRRDDNGRYMDGQGGEMYSPTNGQRGGNGVSMTGYARHPGWLPPYYDGGEMRQHDGGNARVREPHHSGNDRRNADDGNQRRMGGYGGFVWDRMPVSPRAGGDEENEDDDMPYQGNVTSMRSYQKHRQHDDTQRKIGFGEGAGKDHLTRKDAEEWVAMMVIPGDKPGETKRGGKWTFDEIKRYAGNYGMTTEQQIIDFYVAVNMMYSDYCKVAKEYGMDKGVEFFAKMAKAFLHDTDAVKDKLVAYWENIVQKE